jgi:hypothetical protein
MKAMFDAIEGWLTCVAATALTLMCVALTIIVWRLLSGEAK